MNTINWGNIKGYKDSEDRGSGYVITTSVIKFKQTENLYCGLYWHYYYTNIWFIYSQQSKLKVTLFISLFFNKYNRSLPEKTLFSYCTDTDLFQRSFQWYTDEPAQVWVEANENYMSWNTICTYLQNKNKTSQISRHMTIKYLK